MKKVKFLVSLCISKEMEVEIDYDDYTLDDLYGEVDFPIGVYDYLTDDEDDWIVDDADIEIINEITE